MGSVALQFHKVKGSKFFTGFSVSRQGTKALRLQETKFGVPQVHDPRGSYFQHSKFPDFKIQWTKGLILFQVKLEGSQCRFQTCKGPRVPGF